MKCIIDMLKTLSSVCLQCIVLGSLFSVIFILQQQQYAVAVSLLQNADIIPVHANTSDVLTNNAEASNTGGTAQNSSVLSQKQEQSTAAVVENFQNAFCGVDTTTGYSNTNGYIIEYTLPQSCEMPLGIAVDSDARRVWYVSTKRGVLGSYDLKQNKFDQEHVIPVWNSRKDETGFSQAWSVKIDDNNKKQGGGGDIWFTDAQQNAIWRFMKNSQLFEMYKIPGRSGTFGTIYPISLEFDSKNDRIFFVGTYSPSIWIGDISEMRNGTSDGISQVSIPIDNVTFKGIDPLYITAGSLAVDNKRNSVWVSVFSYGNKGEIFRYNLESQSFDKKFDLPPELNSPVGMIVDDNNNNDNNDNSGHLWITNGGSSIFYKLNPNNGKITKFVTSKASPKIFGRELFENISEQTNIRYNNTSSNDNISKNAYTLPYWIQKSSDGSLWFNEQEGNKIGRFDPHDMTLIEYWVPSQNSLWGSCSSGDIDRSISNNTKNQRCGIANVLQFSINTETNSDDDDNDNSDSRRDDNHQNIWFTEWSENKIAKVNTGHKLLPFSVTLSSVPDDKEITIKRGESKEIKVKVIPKDSSSFSTISGNMNIHMIASSTFTSTGDFGSSTASFSKEWLSIDTESDNNNSNHDVSFTFTPSMDLKPGQYTLMIGAEDDAISYQRAIKLRII
jgi:virginiamycin B lyase